MRYVVFALRGTDHRSRGAGSEAAALDVIDAFVADGYAIEMIVDQDGSPVDAMAILDLLEAGRLNPP